MPLNSTSDTIVATNWRQAIERTVTGLGYELVDVERAARGLLRVTIDRVPGRSYPARGASEGAETAERVESADGSEPAAAADSDEFVTVEDCERVTRQLQYALEVAAADYQRLEVSSPGLDRPLRKEADFRRFAGRQVSLTLKLPFQGRKSWHGVLQPAGEGWRLVFDEGRGEQALDFRFDEVREARLVPVVDFKGRRKRNKTAAAQAADAGVNGGQDR